MFKLGAHHLKGFQQFTKLVCKLLFIIHPIKHDVLNEYFLLTESLRPNIMTLKITAKCEFQNHNLIISRIFYNGYLFF